MQSQGKITQIQLFIYGLIACEKGITLEITSVDISVRKCIIWLKALGFCRGSGLQGIVVVLNLSLIDLFI